MVYLGPLKERPVTMSTLQDIAQSEENQMAPKVTASREYEPSSPLFPIVKGTFEPISFWKRLYHGLRVNLPLWSWKPGVKELPPNLSRLLARIPAAWEPRDFILTGSAPLAFRGIRDVNDLDILVSPRLFDLIEKNPEGIYRNSGASMDPYAPYVAEGLDVFNVAPRIGLTFNDIMQWAENFHGFFVQHPAHSLATKALVLPTRSKDRRDIVELAKIVAQLSDDRLLSGTYRSVVK